MSAFRVLHPPLIKEMKAEGAGSWFVPIADRHRARMAGEHLGLVVDVSLAPA